ncbi:hypothetical protein D3C86_1493700 [compost metagenome]
MLRVPVATLGDLAIEVLILRIVDHSDSIGKRFGSLEVIGISHHDGKNFWYLCKCDCGNEDYRVRRTHLRSGTTSSCGCGRLKHGGWKSLEYQVWLDMKDRCNNPNSVSYENYGGRGIKVCSRWTEPEGKGFINFVDDVGPRISKSFTLERKNVNLGYSPDNCIWTDDSSLQNYNQRISSLNTSGKVGVSWDEKISGTKKWKVQISYKEIRKTKRFYTFEEAVTQRLEWELELYGFHVE